MAKHGPGYAIMERGKKGAAAYIHADIVRGETSRLDALLDILLNPAKAIHELETIDWCKWLMAGGRTPEEFSSIVHKYDNATTCGLVWTANFVAYRCRTCAISPCMSLCAECFQRGNHEGHDFNMFRSQAGGACDCGDTSVMKDTGFCDRHGSKSQENKPTPPNDLMCVTEEIMPRVILRLILHLREYSKSNNPDTPILAIQDADGYLSMLHDLSALGAAMRRVMTSVLTNPQIYRQLTQPGASSKSPWLPREMSTYLEESHKIYSKAKMSLPNPKPLPEHKNIAALQQKLVHKTFLEELVFWTVKFEFPQKVVCLLLNMLPDPDYKEALTQAFVLHYSRISTMLETSIDPDTLSNRVVHVSVQLFSNEALALRMVDKLSLLHVMVISLKYMMCKIMIQNTLHDRYKNFHFVVDCASPVMKEHCYWPLVSDLNNVLSHNPVAVRFMSDDSLLEMWFVFLSVFQGMNVNVRELSQHVEFEPNTYYAAFSAELEASAYPMWALLSHLQTPETVHLTRKVLSAVMNALQDWFDAIGMNQISIPYNNQVSFHLPLHRYLAVFMCQAVNTQGLSLSDVLPPSELLHLIMIHPLRVQVAFYEILNGLWVRNGLQIKGQAMTYIQCNFCNSMVDADLYLLQVCATILPPETFVQHVLFRFHVLDWLSFSNQLEPWNSGIHSESDSDPPMLESCLTFLASLISLRTNLGGNEARLSELELVTLLCMGDKTHSQLTELMPERCGTSSSSNRDFESALARVADYRAPNLDASGAMQQGMYSPRAHVWLSLYDPIHVLLRAVHRRDFQSSMDRYNQYLVSSGKLQAGSSAWPPYREPAPPHPSYSDPRCILKCKIFHALSWIVLFKAISQHNVTEHVISLVIYLLEMAIAITIKDNTAQNKTQMCPTDQKLRSVVHDGDLESWYESDWLSLNLRTVITSIISPLHLDMVLDSDSDDEWRSDARAALAIGEVDDRLELEPMFPAVPNPHNRAAGEVVSGSQLAVCAGNELVSSKVLQPTPSSSAVPSEEIPVSNLALPSTDNQVVLAAKPNRGPYGGVYFSVQPNESIISLLLKLHSQLTGAPDSFDPDAATVPDDSENSRVGDGPYFVGKLLMKIMSLDEDCKEAVIKTKESLWPRQPNETERREAEAKQKEERRRKAKERQQKLMEEFASKQRQFMERQTMETEDEGMECSGESSSRSSVEYDCVICNQSSVSTKQKPMGLAVLVQATSVLGARRKNPPLPLLTSDKERSAHSLSNKMSDTMAEVHDQRLRLLNCYFREQAVVNVGWEGGVLVQTCGHHLHLDCLKSYMKSLLTQHRLASERGEYACPLCRQLANSVLPLPPPSSPCSSPVPSTSASSLLNPPSHILALLKETSVDVPSNLMQAVDKALDDMLNATYPKSKVKNSEGITHKPFVSVSSIARTNLEMEIVQRGGSLITPTASQDSLPLLIPKRTCLGVLMWVLGAHCKKLSTDEVVDIWPCIAPCNVPPQRPPGNVPLLLVDPSALITQLILLLPYELDIGYFTYIVKAVYNLLYLQVLVQLSYKMSPSERYQCQEGAGNLEKAFSLVIGYLEPSRFYTCEEAMSNVLKTAEDACQTLCLPFLRVAALLRHHIYQQPLPDIQEPDQEFVRLLYYLELLQDGMSLDRFTGAAALTLDKKLLNPLFSEFVDFVCNSNFSARNLISEQHILWNQPHLIQLPKEYDRIFQYYHRQPCTQCMSVPRESSICLLCGTLVCLKENCCKKLNMCEAVQHSIDCGAGTAMYLVVTSSYVVVIRGKRACLWGSVYLDNFGEEDRELKRGKPLHLSAGRYKLLEQQWLAHRFDHTNKKWVWHRDSL